MQTFVNQEKYPGEFLLHRKYAKNDLLLNLVWTHSNIIADIVLHILEKHQFDKRGIMREVVTQGALLCEIGVYGCGGYEWLPGQPISNKPYIQHGIIGAYILNEEGYLPEVIQIAHTHSGVGITSEDVRNFGLDLPDTDYVPRTQTQKLVAYASKFHSKAPKFKSAEDIIKSLQKFGQGKVQAFQAWQTEFGNPDLQEIIAKYDDWHKGFNYQLSQVTKNATSVGPILNSAGITK